MLTATFTSQGFNLSDDNGSGFLNQSTDQTLTNPRLDPAGLKDNGGPTPTIALLPGSPALDKGNSFGVSTDQRGLARPNDNLAIANASGGDGSDIGAFELNPQARFTSISALANKSTQLQGAGLFNFTYTIQGATNLNPVIQWSNLGAAFADSNGVFSFTDTNAPLFTMRFYRAVWP
jgi:hypothetical protein